MQHPEKWRATANPFALPYRSFEPVEVLGCPHAGNDVFQMRGLYRGRLVEAYVKVGRSSRWRIWLSPRRLIATHA